MSGLTATELATLDRIGRADRLQSAVRKVPRESYRFYLAYCPNGQEAVLRLKDKGGLEAWHQRRWEEKRLVADASRVTIVDTTAQVLEALERCITMPLDEFHRSRTWVDVDQGCRFLFTTEDAPPSPGALHLWSTGEGPGAALCPDPTMWMTLLEFRDSEINERAIFRVRTDMIDTRLLEDLQRWCLRHGMAWHESAPFPS